MQAVTATAVSIAGFKNCVLLPDAMNAAGNNGFWERVEQELRDQKKKKSWLLKKTGLSWTMVGKYRKGSRPALETLRIIAKALKVEPDFLYPAYESLGDVDVDDDIDDEAEEDPSDSLESFFSTGRVLRSETRSALLAIDKIIDGDLRYWMDQADLLEARAAMNEAKAQLKPAKTLAGSPKRKPRT